MELIFLHNYPYAINIIKENVKDDNENELGEKIKNINIHRPIHRKPITDNEFGAYLAGLIEGDGSIKTEGINITIAFYILDAPLAYYIKKRIGYGKISSIKGKNVLIYNSNKAGAIKISKLINGHLRTEAKLQKFNDMLERINKNLQDPTDLINNPIIPKKINTSNILDSYWLAGFSDADSSFQIKILNIQRRKYGKEMRLNYQVDQKTRFILDQIQNAFGGYVGYRSSQDTYYYGSISFGSAQKVLNYFDKYHLLSSKYLNYVKWRRVYILILNKKHLTIKGIALIEKIKSKMNSFSNRTWNL